MVDDAIGSANDLSTSIQDLPDELLDIIFRRLSTYDIKQKVAFVCKRWYELSKNPVFVRDVYFGPKLTLDVILNIMDKATNLTKLDIYGRKDLDIILEKVAFVTDKLRQLKVHTGKATKECQVTGAYLLAVLQRCPRIEKLVVKRTMVHNCDLFFETFGKIGRRIKKVNFNHSLQFGSEDLMDMVNDCQNLEDVRIYCLAINRIGSLSPYGDVPVMALCHKMSTTLTTLKLNALGLSDAVMPFLADCRRIYKLHLYRMVNVHDEGLIMLSNLESLTQLTVTMPRVISSECWKSLFSCPNFRHLEKLTISNSYSINDEVLANLAEHCVCLTSIGLPGCRKITDIGVAALLLSCSSLLHVNLFSTKFCISSTFHLIPEHLPLLQTLIYRAIDRTGFTFPDFLKEIPTLQLRQYYRYV